MQFLLKARLRFNKVSVNIIVLLQIPMDNKLNVPDVLTGTHC